MAEYIILNGITVTRIESVRDIEFLQRTQNGEVIPADKKTVEDLAKAKKIILPEGYKAEKDTIRIMTDYEKAQEGLLTLEDYRKIKRSEISSAYEQERTIKNNGLQSKVLNTKIDCRDTDILNIQSIVSLYKITGQAPDYYKTFDNKKVPCDGAKFELVLAELINQQLSFWLKKDLLVNQIDEAKDIETLNNIKWV
jgi:hypothetical protein